MGQLNIKSDRAEALVSRLVALTGESKTQAVVTALEERLARMEQDREAEVKARTRAILAAARGLRDAMGDELPSNRDLDRSLYDPATGLPR
jgi:antitoxin VapB